MRTWGNSYADAVAESSTPGPLDAKNEGVYAESFYVDDALDGGSPGSAVIPSGSRPRLVLDYRPIRGTLSATINGIPAAVNVQFGTKPTVPGTIAVDWLSGIVEFCEGDTGAVVFTYKHYGTVITAHDFNRLQKMVHAGIPPNVARLDAAQNWTALQTFDERPVVDDGLTLPEGGSPVLTADDPLNASMLTYGIVPLARMPSQVARRDVANTFAGANTFNGECLFSGIRHNSVRELAAGTHTLEDTDSVIHLHSASGNITINLPPDGTGVRMGKFYEFLVITNGGSNTITVVSPSGSAFRLNGVYVVGSRSFSSVVGSYSQITKAYVEWRYFEMIP